MIARVRILPLCLALAACGTTQPDRLTGGAGAGALAGAAVGVVTDVSVVHGALLGAAAGVVVAAVTDSDQVNLGAPPWSRDHAARDAASASSPGTVKDIQYGLRERGLYEGAVDGIAGPRTAAAIRRYQQDHGLLVDGRPSAELADHIAANS